jgi:choline dehydrogenase-like flavoprotein
VARRLAEHGLRVKVLEAGASITDPPGSHLRNTASFRATPDSYFASINQYLNPVNADADAILPGAADSSLLGGQGVLWTNNCSRAAEFERWGAFSADLWEQKYAQAEMLLGVISDPSQQSMTGHAVADRLGSVLAREHRRIRGLPLAGRVLDSGALYFNGPWDTLQGAEPEVRERIEIEPSARVSRIYSGNRQAI